MPQTARRVTFDLTDLTVREEPLPGEDPRKLRDARKEGRLALEMKNADETWPWAIRQLTGKEIPFDRRRVWRQGQTGAQPYRVALFTPLVALTFERPSERGDGFLSNLKDPPPPQPLLFLPLVVGTKLVRALLDSGASDSFVSLEVAKMLGQVQYPLLQPLTVRVANVEFLPVTHVVSLSG